MYRSLLSTGNDVIALGEAIIQLGSDRSAGRDRAIHACSAGDEKENSQEGPVPHDLRQDMM